MFQWRHLVQLCWWTRACMFSTNLWLYFKQQYRSRGMTRWLRECIALAKDLSSVLSNLAWWHTTTSNSSSGDLKPSSGLWGHLCSCAHSHTERHMVEGMPWGTLEVRGQLTGICLLLQLSRRWWSNWSHQAWHQSTFTHWALLAAPWFTFNHAGCTRVWVGSQMTTEVHKTSVCCVI